MKVRICPMLSIYENSEDFGKKLYELPLAYYFTLPQKNAYAKGYLVQGGFLVLAGSLAALKTSASLSKYHKQLRQMMIDEQFLQRNDGYLQFVRPCVFKNEYDATCIVAGNNRIRTKTGVWKDRYGKTLIENKIIGVTEFEAAG